MVNGPNMLCAHGPICHVYQWGVGPSAESLTRHWGCLAASTAKVRVIGRCRANVAKLANRVSRGNAAARAATKQHPPRCRPCAHPVVIHRRSSVVGRRSSSSSSPPPSLPPGLLSLPQPPTPPLPPPTSPSPSPPSLLLLLLSSSSF